MAFAPAVPVAPAARPLPLEKLSVYTVATLPTAAQYKDCIIIVTNGDAGSPCLAVSDGVDWFKVAVGAACAAA